MAKELTREVLTNARPSIGDSMYHIHGFSVYRGVIIIWGATHDERVKYVVDLLDTWDWLDRLVAVHKHTGPTVMLFWDGEPPSILTKAIMLRNELADDGEICTRWDVESHVCP